MNVAGNNELSWVAPIIPSISLCGIPLGLSAAEFLELLGVYLIGNTEDLYQFYAAPVLQLKKIESEFGEIYLFNVHDRNLTNWHLYFDSPDHRGANPRALAVVVKNNKVHTVKVWNFEKVKEGDMPKNIYQGKLPGGIGLGDKISEILEYGKLKYDAAEGFFYTDPEYGMLELTGFGDLDEYPNQTIMALAVVSDC